MKGKDRTQETRQVVKVRVRGKERTFDIDNPDLPDWIDKNDLSADHYPYDKKMKRKEY